MNEAQDSGATVAEAEPDNERRRRGRLRTAGIAGTALGFLAVGLIILIAALHERTMKEVPVGRDTDRSLRDAPRGLSPSPASPSNGIAR